MKKIKYKIACVDGSSFKYQKAIGYRQEIALPNGLKIKIGLRKAHNCLQIDDIPTGLAITKQTFNTRKEALQKAIEILELQEDN